MTRKELVEAIFHSLKKHNATLPKAAINNVIDGFFQSMIKRLSLTGKVQLPIGVFTIKQRAARKGHNVKTGETIDVPAKNGLKFRPSKEFKAAVTEGKVFNKENDIKVEPQMLEFTPRFIPIVKKPKA
eukprot:GEZU01029724.1.p1 GENE.GEZU01029724.1~~GEZU01029724.1.p1  ORF type:complete len:128 (+),score=50.52 GEZU01029724.1:62-445(+)